MEDYDPYRKWLGIPPAEQPPDHYRLLGIGRFEDDSDTIANAADRQMAHVRTYQIGPHSALSQQLLNEIAVARICLLDATKKAEYDNQLRAKDARQTQPLAETSSPQQLAPRPIIAMPPIPPAARVVPTITARPQSPAGAAPQTPAPQSQWPQIGPLAADSTPVRVAPPARRRRPRITTLRTSAPQQSEAHKTLLIAAALAAIVLAAFVVYKTRSGPGGTVTDEQTAAANQLAKDDADKAREIAESQDASIADAIVPRPVVMASEDSLTDIPLPEQPPSEQPPSPASADSASADAAAVADPVDGAASKLLTSAVAWYRAEGNANDSAGKHHGKLQGGASIVKIEKGHAFELDGEHGHVVISESPQLNATGQITTMAWICAEPTWAHVVTAATDANGEQRTGFYMGISPNGHLYARFNAPGEPWDAHQAWGPESVDFGKWVHVAATYDGRMLAVYANGVSVLATEVGHKPVDLTGARLVIGGLDAAGFARFKGMIDEVVVFDRGLDQAEIGTIFRATSVGKVSGNDVPRDEIAPSEELTPKQQSPVKGYASAGTEDVLARIDLARDALDGDWKREGAALVSPVQPSARLQLPCTPGEDYELTVEVERLSGLDACVIGLVVGGRQAAMTLDGWGGETTGLTELDHRDGSGNESTRRGRRLPPGQPHAVVCTVHAGSVRVTCDGRETLAWSGDSERLSNHALWEVADKRRLFLGAWESKFKYTRIEVRPLPASEKQPPSPSVTLNDLQDAPWRNLLDRKSLAGWTGDIKLMRFQNGVLASNGKQAIVMVPGDHANFEFEMEFRLAQAGNSGLGICHSGSGEPGANGLEVELIDDGAYPGLRDSERCGAIFWLADAKAGHFKRWPKWNRLRVTSLDDIVRVELNGTLVTDTTRSLMKQRNPQHKGVSRTSGKICLLPRQGRSEYRHIRIRESRPSQ